MPERSTALVITGMHRSGTSLASSAFGRMGVEIGRDLVPPDRRNPKGYFEDIDFLELQRRILRECSPVDDGGHVDWGWTPSERLDRGPTERFRDEARRLAESRAARFRYWAWKDPRTTQAFNLLCLNKREVLPGVLADPKVPVADNAHSALERYPLTLNL